MTSDYSQYTLSKYTDMNIDWKEQQKRFEDLILRAHNRIWRSAPTDFPILSLRSNRIPNKEQFLALQDLMKYANTLGVKLSISGGGYGCIDIQFTATFEKEEDFLKLINDPKFQEYLEKLDVNRVSKFTGSKTYTFVQYERFKMLYATNRKRRDNPEASLSVYGNDFSENLVFGTLEAIILPEQSSQKKSNFFQKIWINITGKNWSKLKNIRINSINITEYSKEQLEDILKSFNEQSAMIQIHGFATDFKDAVIAAINFYLNIRIENLNITPILFSWPSLGSQYRYNDDKIIAEQSQPYLLETIRLLDKYYRQEVHIVAHSHGNKILHGAMTSQSAMEIQDKSLGYAILCAPDIDKTILEQKLIELLRPFQKAFLYISKNDLAIYFARLIYGGNEIDINNLDTDDLKLEIIDASATSTDLIGHSYYSQAIPVLNDIYGVLQEVDAQKRFGLRPIRNCPNAWKLVPR